MLGDDHLHDDDNDEKEYDDDDALVKVPWQGSKSGQKPLLVDLFLPDDENGVDDLENGDDDGDHPSSLSSSSPSSSDLFDPLFMWSNPKIKGKPSSQMLNHRSTFL